MANFFSADYWKALYFKAMGGQETAVDPNAMSGSFAGSSEFAATLTSVGTEEVQSRSQGGGPDPHYYKKRKKKQPEPVSKEFGDKWQPPVQRPAPPATLPLPAREIIARQDAAFAKTQAAIVAALEQMERQQTEADALAYELAEQEDEDEAILLLMAA